MSLENSAVSNRRVVLMWTATAIATNGKDNHNRAKCRLFLDKYCQRSYITRSMADMIDAKSIKADYLAIGVFRASTLEYLSMEVVDITTSDEEDKDSIQLKPVVAEKIFNPMQRHALETINTSLRDLNLADIYHCNDEVDIETLIRMDFYWNIVKGEAIKQS